MTDLVPSPSLSGDLAVAEQLFKSRVFNDIRNAQGALVKIMLGRAMGIDPGNAMMGLFVSSQGKLTMTANLMYSRILAKKNDAGKQKYKVRRLEHTDRRCVLQVWERIDDDWEECGPPVMTTIEEFRFLAIGPNKKNWEQYPKNMLFARAVSNVAKFCCADAFGGSPVYLPDEIPGTGVEIDGDTLEPRKVEVISVSTNEVSSSSGAVATLLNEFSTTSEELAALSGVPLESILSANDSELEGLRRLLQARKDQARTDA